MAALASWKARVKRSRLPAPASTSEQYRAAAVTKAAQAKTLAYHAAYYQGQALVREALAAATAMKWGAAISVVGSGPQRNELPLTLHFSGGHRAVVAVNGTLTLHP